MPGSHIIDLPAQHRLILAAMGIELWVLADSPTRMIQGGIWRDQNEAGMTMQSMDTTAAHNTETAADLTELQFMLDVIVLPHCAIMTDLYGKSGEDVALWEKVAGAVEHQHLRLDFPVPVFLDRSSSAIQSYIQGFLSQFSKQRRLICLGELPVINMDALGITQIPALPEFHSNPSLKKRLWSTMKTSD